MSEFCHCGWENSYESCCGRLHEQEDWAKTAEELMRSRYCAFVMKRADYLLTTQWGASEDLILKRELEQGFRQTQWLELRVFKCTEGQLTDSRGRVHFVASYFSRGQVGELDEDSAFVKKKSRWYYLAQS